MNNDLISRQAAIDALNEYFVRIGKLKRRGLNKGEKAIRLDTVGAINSLPPAQPDNKINLCDSCKHTFPACPARSTDVIWGNGTWNDNICVCSKYEPSAQQEQKVGKWIRHENEDGEPYGHNCSVCGEWYVMPYGKTKFCPNCGAKMEEQDANGT